MSAIQTRIATPQDFPAIAALIQKHSQMPATQCIHSSTGENIESLIAEMEKWHKAGEIIFVMAWDDNALLGVMGCEFEKDGTRGWLRGPFAASRWEAVAAALYARLRDAVPPAIARLDAFLNLENTRGQAFYEAQNFQQKGQSHVYVADRPAHVYPPPALSGSPCTPLSAPTHQSFAALHDAVFPGTYYTGQQIIEQIDERHQAWVYAPDGDVLGYIYAIVEQWAEEGYVDGRESVVRCEPANLAKVWGGPSGKLAGQGLEQLAF